MLFVGPPGVGKTMLAIALARAAVEAGHRVYFTTAADLAARCHKAALEGRWNHLHAVLRRPPSCWSSTSSATCRCPATAPRPCSRSSTSATSSPRTILTTNVGIADWAGAFGDAMVAAAMLDRLLHRATVVGIDGPSYRLRAHQRTADTLRAAAGHRPGPAAGLGGSHAS